MRRSIYLITIVFLTIVSILNCSNEEEDFEVPNELYGLTQEDINEALQIHNNARKDVGISKLNWSEALSRDASKWAKQMAKDDRMYHSENDSRPGQGENLFYTTATDSLTPARNASRLWYNEIELYTYSPIMSGQNNFSEIGHYTQMVWNSTTEVGMAMAVSSTGKTYVAARYSPAGNFIGEYPY